MEIYFGGAERPNVIHLLAEAGVRTVMVSYASYVSANCWRLLHDYGFEILADSGAFTMWKQGRSLDVLAYMDWIQENGVAHYFNLDVVGDPLATAANQEAMEASGFHPVPVFHHGSDWAILDAMIGKHDLIGLGGTVGMNTKRAAEWFVQVLDRHPDQKFHGLGSTNQQFLTLPFWSVDSTWYLYKHRDGRRFDPGGDRAGEILARIRHLQTFEHMGRSYQMALPI